MEKLNAFRPWFYAAAVYNAGYGTFVSLFPDAMFRWLGMPASNYPWLYQAIGMIVGVYAIGYWLVARDPARFGPFVYIGLAGKILGPIGFVTMALQGKLPWVFGWINVFNDLIWLPSFIPFAILVWKLERNRPTK